MSHPDEPDAPNPPLRLRTATVDDAVTLWEWANDPLVRRSSLATAPIAWSRHTEWFDRILRSENAEIYLAHLGPEPVGQVRFEIQPTDAMRVSLSVAAHRRGQGLARPILREGIRLLRAAHAEPLVAEIRQENAASLRCFTAEGFRVVETKAGVVHLVLDPVVAPSS